MYIGPDAFCTAYGSSVCDLAGKDADLDLTFTPAYAADKVCMGHSSL